MLPLQLQSNNVSRLSAILLAVLVNISLAGLIYGLTIGSYEPIAKTPISIDFRQFRDSSVEEKTLSPDLTVKPEDKPVVEPLPAPTIQPNLTVANLNLESRISLPAMAMPEFNVTPNLQAIAVPDMAQPNAHANVDVVTAVNANASSEMGFAKVLRKVQPQYPYKAQRLKIEGHVLLHILIDDSGRPQEIKVIEESPRGYFAKSARKAVRRWHFEKAPAGTQVWKQWRLAFELN